MTAKPSIDMEQAFKRLGESKEMERVELLHTVRVGDGHIRASEFIKFSWRFISFPVRGLSAV